MHGKNVADARRDREEDRAWREEQRAAERDRLAREKQARVSLADAVAPRTAIEGTAVDTPAGMTLYKDPEQAQAAQQEAQIEQEMRDGPTLAQARPAYGVTGTSLGNQITTQRPDVAALNSPDARMSRVVDATMATDPAKAISLQSAALGIKNTEEQMEDRRRTRAAAVKREGLEGTFRALRTRDPQAVFDAFNAQGDAKLVAPPELVGTKKFKTPWGEVDDDVWSAKVVGPDGKERSVQMSTMQVGQQLASVSDLLKQEGEAGKIGLQHRNDLDKDKVKLGNDITLEGVRTSNTMKEIGARGGQERATLDHRRATGADKSPLGREERLRYTTLFQDAGRRMAEAQKALSTLQKNPLYSIAKPGTAQHTELQGLRDTIRQYGDERSMYQSLLAESQTAPASKGGGGAQKDGKPATVSSKAERDALPKGARYIGPDGQTYIKQ